MVLFTIFVFDNTDQFVVDQRRSKILEWLSDRDPSSSQDSFRTRRQLGTGSWLVKGEEFKKWKSDSKSSLWIYASRMSFFVFDSFLLLSNDK